MFIKVNCLHKGYNHNHQPAVSVIIHRDIWHNPILYFQIAHNTLCFPPKFCISYGLQMLLGKCRILRNIWKQMFMQNLGGKLSVLWGIRKKHDSTPLPFHRNSKSQKSWPWYRIIRTILKVSQQFCLYINVY